jgi:hypothetical protein
VSRVWNPEAMLLCRFFFRSPVARNAVLWPNPAYLANFSQRTWLKAANGNCRKRRFWPCGSPS